ncbi:MAG: PAS domain S-box protein [Promethearchaeota archaeon]
MDSLEEVFLQILENINDLICIINETLEIEFINELVFLKLLGYSKKDLLGKHLSEIISEKDSRKLKKFIKNIDKVDKPSLVIQFLHQEGMYIWFENKIMELIVNKGTRKYLLILKDISEKKQTELTLKKSTEKYQSIISNIKEGYYEVDLKGKFTFVNDALCGFLGYSRDELLGKSYNLAILDDKTSKLVFKTYNKVFRTEIQQNIFQFQVKRKNGGIAFFETSVYLKNDSKGRKIGFYGIVRDITERKREEDLEEKFKIELTQKVRIRTKELEESEEKYSNLFHHSNDGIFMHDLDGNIIDVNQKVLELFGYTKSEIISLKISDLHPASELAESTKAFEEISEKGFVRFDINFKKKNDEIFLAEVSSSLFSIGGKKFIQGIVRDITVRKEAEIKLKESEEKYRNMINNLDLGFFQVNWGGELLNYNPAFSRILGFKPDEKMITTNVKNFWQNPNERNSYLNELKKKGVIKNYLVHSKMKNGQKIVLQLNSHLIKEENKEPIKIQGLISDVTEKFELEQKLKESENRYRNLIESVPFSIALIDQSGKVIYCNPAVENLLGYSREELMGNEFRKLPAINQKYLPTMLERFKKVAEGEPLSPFDAEFYKKDGRLIWVNYQTSLVNLGNEFFIQAILHDITKRKRADLLIQEEIQKLKELDQIRKDLISRVSHELKTPLVSVCGASELLLEMFENDLNKDTKELIEMIEKGGARLKFLVDNLLDITRIEFKQFKLEMEPYNLCEIIKDCAKEMRYLIKKRKIELKLELPDELIVHVDRVRFEQVILNLLSNAIKNTPPNGKTIINLVEKGDWADISVVDTGIGLTRDEMDRIFTRFGKLERYGEGLEYIDIQGSGLGLYISKEIIDLHNGHLWAESPGRDKGSKFIVRIPILT